MAWDTPKSKSPVFPSSRLKSFVRDVASLKRSHSGHSRQKPVESTVGSEDAWSIVSDFPAELPERKAGISVQLSLSFEDPLEFSCNRCYNSSSDFSPSERLLRGLVRRIDHGSFELITRKDPHAFEATRGEGKAKTKRFEMAFQISQKGVPWATRTYRSYQKDVLTAEAVKEVVLSTHRLIGLFLRQHDSNFVWKDGPIRDEILEISETSPYRVGGTQPLSCIPRSRFLEESQSFEAIPGFTIELSLTSRSQRRKPPEWQKVIKIDSSQTTPLNLDVAEALFSNASYALEAVLRSKRRTIEERHRNGCGFISATCQHYEDEATDINLRIANNLGPQFDHLFRNVHSKLVLISQPEAKECNDFIANLEAALGDARDTADHTIGRMNDFDFRVVELRGRGWSLDEPLSFTLGARDSYSRRSIQAILDRVQAGVADTLKGNAATVRMSAAKRGHYILDKTLLSRTPNADASRWSIPSKSKAKIVDRLKRRIQQDIDMICRDTCSLDNLDDSNVPVPCPEQADIDPFAVATGADPEAVLAPLPETPSTRSGAGSGQLGSPCPGPITTKSEVPSSTLSQTEAMSATDSESSARSRPSSVIFSKMGARAFPLVPTSSSYGFKEFFDPNQTPVSLEVPSSGSAPGTQTGPETSRIDRSSLPENDHVAHSVLGHDSRQEDEPASSPQRDDESKVKTHNEGHDAEVSTDIQQRRTSTATIDKQKRHEADEVSLTPSTPSLTYGGEHSARSSLVVFTPHFRDTSSGAEVEVVATLDTSESRTEDSMLEQSVNNDSQQKFLGFPGADSPSRSYGQILHKPNPSPLHHQDHASDDEAPTPRNMNAAENNLLHTDDVLDCQLQMTTSGTQVDETANSSKVVATPESLQGTDSAATEDMSVEKARSEEVLLSGNISGPQTFTTPLVEPSSDPSVHEAEAKAPKTHDRSPRLAQLSVHPVAATLAETSPPPIEMSSSGIRTPVSDGFAQTRQELDFDFSSPWSMATPYSEGHYQNLDDAIDDTNGPQDFFPGLDNANTNVTTIQRASSSSLLGADDTASGGSRSGSRGPSTAAADDDGDVFL